MGGCLFSTGSFFKDVPFQAVKATSGAYLQAGITTTLFTGYRIRVLFRVQAKKGVQLLPGAQQSLPTLQQLQQLDQGAFPRL